MNLRIARYIDRWVGLIISFLLWGVFWVRGSLPGLGATTPPVDDSIPRPRRVLGIKFYGLGNIAMILPTVDAMCAQGDVEFDFLTLRGNRSLLEQSGVIARVHTIEVVSIWAFLRSMIDLLANIRSDYDAVLDFEQFMKLSGIIARLSDAAVLVGFNTDGQKRGWLYTHRVAYADTDHMTDLFMRLAAPFGLQVIPAPRFRLPVRAADRDVAIARLPADAGENLVLMHVGTGPNFSLKRWAPENFAVLADHLIARTDAHVVLTGLGADESELVESVLSSMEHAGRTTNGCDMFSVSELIGLLDASRFVVTNDTSLLHLAGLTYTPTVTFFGSTEPKLYGPRGPLDMVFYEQLFCSPCISNYNLKMSRCVNPVCMRRIKAPDVIQRIETEFLPALDAARAGKLRDGVA